MQVKVELRSSGLQHLMRHCILAVLATRLTWWKAG